MKFFGIVLLATIASSAWAFEPTMVCNVNLMKVNQEIFMPAGSERFETVASKSFSQGHGAIMTVNSPVFLYDETVQPEVTGRRRPKPKKEEVVLTLGHMMKSWENDEEFMGVLVRESEKNKHGVYTKREELGRFSVKGADKTQVVMIDKYAVQVACNVVKGEE